jgi:penicillin-binding protein 1A
MRRSRARRLGILGSLGAAVLIVLLAVLGYLLAVIPDLPKLRTSEADLSLASIVYSADGEEIARFYREDRIWKEYGEISPDVIKALIAAEDHRFYEHSGVDVRRLFSSAVKTVRGERQGGSTLSMQLSRNLYPEEIGSAQTLHRKTREVLTALRIERNFEKHQIVEMYLNTIAFGYNAFGIESAARRYFNRSADDLTLAESATLVGMLKGPSHYNPVRHPERAVDRRNVVLQRMRELGAITAEELRETRDDELILDFQPGRPAGTIAPHFAEHVQSVVGEWAEQRGYDLYSDGLRIHTTLDTRIQKMANEAVAKQAAFLQRAANNEWAAGGVSFGGYWASHGRVLDDHLRRTADYRRLVSEQGAEAALRHVRSDAALVDSVKRGLSRLQAGLVAIDPADGSVKAWVGGTDHRVDQYDKVAQARRQPGSAFKPIVYTAAVDYGFSPFSTVQDTLVTVSLPGSRRTWTPTNSGGGYSNQMMTVRDALVYSKNTITTQLVQDVGIHQVAAYARRMGIKSGLDPVPSIGLGTSEVTLLELTASYVTLATGGIRKEPQVITRIENRHGRTIERFSSRSDKAISSYTAYTVVDMMRGVVQQGTGSALRWQFGVNADVAAKTGTSQNYADGWFVAMHPRLVTGAWVGFNDRRVRFRTGTHGQGGRNALRLVGDFFGQVLEADPALREARFSPPAGYVEPRPPEYDDGYRYAYEYDAEYWDEYFRDVLGEESDSEPRDAIDTTDAGSSADWREELRRLRRDDDPDANVEEALRRATAPRPADSVDRREVPSTLDPVTEPQAEPPSEPDPIEAPEPIIPDVVEPEPGDSLRRIDPS